MVSEGISFLWSEKIVETRRADAYWEIRGWDRGRKGGRSLNYATLERQGMAKNIEPNFDSLFTPSSFFFLSDSLSRALPTRELTF